MKNKLKVEITKEDIEKSQWHNHYCAEALAFKRALKENNIHFLSAKVAAPKRGSVLAVIFYPEYNKETDELYIKSFIQKLPELTNWSRKLSNTFKEGWGGTIWNRHLCFNPNYDGTSKKDILPTSFEITLPDGVVSAEDFDWVRNEYSEEYFAINNKLDHRISDLKIILELNKLNSEKVLIDWLMCGELARRDFSNYKNKKILIDGKWETETKDEVLVPTFSFTPKIFHKQINFVLEKIKNKKDAILLASIRYVSFGEIEAGFVAAWNKK